MTDSRQRRWLITGVSTGLGQSLLRTVMRYGQAVAGTVRTIPDQSATVPGPGRAKLFAMDVADEPSVGRAVGEAAAWLGGIDIVVNNAGLGMFGTVEACSLEDFRRAMEVNFFGLVTVTQHVLPHLRASRGVLVNVGSMSSLVEFGGTSPYAASKHAVLGLSEALSAELAPLGVRVVVAVPGGFRTEFWSERSNTIRENPETVYGAYPFGQIRQRASAHRGHELGDPDKFAELLVKVVAQDHPPLYLVLGADALELVEAKRKRMIADIEGQKVVAVATGFT